VPERHIVQWPHVFRPNMPVSSMEKKAAAPYADLRLPISERPFDAATVTVINTTMNRIVYTALITNSRNALLTGNRFHTPNTIVRHMRKTIMSAVMMTIHENHMPCASHVPPTDAQHISTMMSRISMIGLSNPGNEKK